MSGGHPRAHPGNYLWIESNGMSFLRKQESRIFIRRYFHIDHPRMGYSALSVSTSMPFSISLFVFPFGTQIPTIHGLHTKPDGEHCISA
jgi:hypothetical protein